jgi:branched-chain amino acid transport system substrate-binding protein
MSSMNVLIIAAVLSLTTGAAAEDIPVKIGVLNDRSGIYSDLSGEGW